MEDMQTKLDEVIDEAIMHGETRAANGLDWEDHTEHTEEGYCAFAWG